MPVSRCQCDRMNEDHSESIIWKACASSSPSPGMPHSVIIRSCRSPRLTLKPRRLNTDLPSLKMNRRYMPTYLRTFLKLQAELSSTWQLTITQSRQVLSSRRVHSVHIPQQPPLAPTPPRTVLEHVRQSGAEMRAVRDRQVAEFHTQRYSVQRQKWMSEAVQCAADTHIRW